MAGAINFHSRLRERPLGDLRNLPMAGLSDEQQRAVRVLAQSERPLAGHHEGARFRQAAQSEKRATQPGSRMMTVWLKITFAGWKAAGG